MNDKYNRIPKSQLEGADRINKTFKECFKKRIWGGKWKIRSSMSLYASIAEHRIISESHLLNAFALLLLRSHKLSEISQYLGKTYMKPLIGDDHYSEWQPNIEGFKALLSWDGVNRLREGYEPSLKYKIQKDHLLFAAKAAMKYAENMPEKCTKNQMMQFFQGALIPHHILPKLYEGLDSFTKLYTVLGPEGVKAEKVLEYIKS